MLKRLEVFGTPFGVESRSNRKADQDRYSANRNPQDRTRLHKPHAKLLCYQKPKTVASSVAFGWLMPRSLGRISHYFFASVPSCLDQTPHNMLDKRREPLRNATELPRAFTLLVCLRPREISVLLDARIGNARMSMGNTVPICFRYWPPAILSCITGQRTACKICLAWLDLIAAYM